MKTWVVLVRVPNDQRSWIGNAESAEEAVKYAIAKAGLVASAYVVWDHDLNRFDVLYPLPAKP